MLDNWSFLHRMDRNLSNKLFFFYKSGLGYSVRCTIYCTLIYISNDAFLIGNVFFRAVQKIRERRHGRYHIKSLEAALYIDKIRTTSWKARTFFPGISSLMILFNAAHADSINMNPGGIISSKVNSCRFFDTASKAHELQKLLLLIWIEIEIIPTVMIFHWTVNIFSDTPE